MSPFFTTLRQGAEYLLIGAPESLSLAVWGCGLLFICSAVRAMNESHSRLQRAGSKSEARGPFAVEPTSVADSGAGT